MVKVTQIFAVLAAMMIGLSVGKAYSETATPTGRDASDAALVRLYVLQCGMMDMSEWDHFEQIFGTSKDTVAVPKQANPCFLVTHGDKALLWDAGFPDSMDRIPHLSKYGVYESMAVKLADQLNALDIKPRGTIDYVALSHVHFDHVGNLGTFLNSTILMRKAEFDDVYNTDGEIALGYEQETLDYLDQARDLRMIEGNYDVFGDGSVVLIPAPGHTAGSQVMLVRLKNYGSVIISGDTVHFQEEFDGEFVSSLNRDKAQAGKTLEMIKDLLVQENAELWIQHDPVHYISWKLMPAYYD